LKKLPNRKLVPATNTDIAKAKFYSFHDNYRPPYYGTWRWKSKSISGRRPFSKKEKRLNYEYDSDQEWEQEPSDADECKSDEEELEKDELEEDENDGFFVDHGYLSTDEGSENGIDEIEVKGEDEEQRKKRLEQRADEWKENQRQKERRFRKRFLVPNIYLPEEDTDQNSHNPHRRYILPGVLFDYSKLTVLQRTPQSAKK